jgi:diguanylate cyclase
VYKPGREEKFAKTALALMGKCGVAIMPVSFELFYTYAAGENLDLIQAMDAMIVARTSFTPETLLQLRHRHLSGAHDVSVMNDFGADMRGMIDSVLNKLEASARDTSNYKQQLSDATGALGDQRSPADLRVLVDGLINATRAMEARTKSLEGELQASSQQVAELRHKLDDVRKESMTDPLTGIANRKAFDDAMRQVQNMVNTPGGEAASLLLCDIDHFKQFNDNWGHQVGDQVLRLVANSLADNVKGRDTAARYGGEEFMVLLQGANLDAATHIATQICEQIRAKKLIKKSTGEILGTITVSIGVAQIAPGESAETVMRRVDACLYGAKNHGRNLVVNQNDPRVATLETDAA